jgi:hypothetical protein
MSTASPTIAKVGCPLPLLSKRPADAAAEEVPTAVGALEEAEEGGGPPTCGAEVLGGVAVEGARVGTGAAGERVGAAAEGARVGLVECDGTAVGNALLVMGA